MSGPSTGTAGAVLVLIISVSLFQAAVFLTQPRNPSLVSINPYTAHEGVQTTGLVNASAPSQVVTSTQTVTVSTAFPTTVAVTVPTIVSVTNTTTVFTQPPQDYTPIGIVIIVAVGIVALALIFMRRQRQP